MAFRLCRQSILHVLKNTSGAGTGEFAGKRAEIEPLGRGILLNQTIKAVGGKVVLVTPIGEESQRLPVTADLLLVLVEELSGRCANLLGFGDQAGACSQIGSSQIG